MRKLFRVQADLFVTSVRAAELIGIERQKAVSLLQALLTEAVVKRMPVGEPKILRSSNSPVVGARSPGSCSDCRSAFRGFGQAIRREQTKALPTPH
jgi:hypothetical protein